MNWTFSVANKINQTNDDCIDFKEIPHCCHPCLALAETSARHWADGWLKKPEFLHSFDFYVSVDTISSQIEVCLFQLHYRGLLRFVSITYFSQIKNLGGSTNWLWARSIHFKRRYTHIQHTHFVLNVLSSVLSCDSGCPLMFKTNNYVYMHAIMLRFAPGTPYYYVLHIGSPQIVFQTHFRSAHPAVFGGWHPSWWALNNL